MEHWVEVAPGVRLWVAEQGDGTPLLLVMGANASGVTWPPALVSALADRHRVIVYDHRDTGRSTRAFDSRPYAIRDLATDAVSVLDALGIPRAHVAGMSMGGTLAQLLLVDHPSRLLSATVFATSSLGAGLADPDGANPAELPGPAPELLELWSQLGDERTPEAELDFRVAHWRLLNGDVLPFDPAEFRALEERVIAHSGTAANAAAHALADQSGLDRGADLARVTVPTLVIEAPEDPVNPPPHASFLARSIAGASLVTIPGMGHALPSSVLPPLTRAILDHTAAVDASSDPGGTIEA